MILRLTEKTGFVSPDPVIIIYDLHGTPFYVKKRLPHESRTHFNLPRGEFRVKSNIAKYDFRNYSLPELYKNHGNRFLRLPKKFKTVWCKNPNKCSVDLLRGIIYFDHEYKKYPSYVIAWIKRHELGHYFYRGQGQHSEKCCDLFAAYCMLQEGYNPSQINHAIDVLSDSKEAEARKKHLSDHLKKVK